MQDLEQTKLGQSDERTIYEVRSILMITEASFLRHSRIEVDYFFFKVQQGREPLDVDFCSVTVDGTLDNDILQQRILDVARQREELEQIEIEMRAQMIARTEIIEMQNSYEAQLKEHSNAASKLQV